MIQKYQINIWTPKVAFRDKIIYKGKNESYDWLPLVQSLICRNIIPYRNKTEQLLFKENTVMCSKQSPREWPKGFIPSYKPWAWVIQVITTDGVNS